MFRFLLIIKYWILCCKKHIGTLQHKYILHAFDYNYFCLRDKYNFYTITIKFNKLKIITTNGYIASSYILCDEIVVYNFKIKIN